MSRFLRALKFIVGGGRAAKEVVVEESTMRTAISLLRDVASTIEEIVPESIKSSIASFLSDKSQAEVIFLSSALLAVLLFAIILPAYEALFEDCDDYGNDHGMMEDELTRSLRKLSSSSPLRVYKPGYGVVEVDAEDVAGAIASSPSCESSRRSVFSCGSMETIEESEEEYDLEEDDISDRKSDDSSISSLIEETLEGKILFTEEDTVIDKVKYYQFLHINSIDDQSTLNS